MRQLCILAKPMHPLEQRVLPAPGLKRSSWEMESTRVDSSSSMAAVAMAAASPLYVAASSAGLPSCLTRPLRAGCLCLQQCQPPPSAPAGA